MQQHHLQRRHRARGGPAAARAGQQLLSLPVRMRMQAGARRRAGQVAHAASKKSVSNADLKLWGTSQWTFPAYLQSADPESSISGGGSGANISSSTSGRGSRLSVGDGEPDEASTSHGVWAAIRREAQQVASSEPVLSSFLHASVLTHDTFEQSLAFVLANRLANSILLSSQLFDIVLEALVSSEDVADASLKDIEAFHARDPACTSYAMAHLWFKGYHALQTHRVAHVLWKRGRKLLAITLQSRLSEVFGVDIHPAARIGAGVFVDHAVGLVVGETCVIGDNVTLMQDVTLGGTGKEAGDRHPKISDHVLIGASAKVLGNIQIGRGALIAPGALVLKPVEPYMMVAGAPAEAVGMRPASIRSMDPV